MALNGENFIFQQQSTIKEKNFLEFLEKFYKNSFTN